MNAINVRKFIQENYTPYDGDASFLAGPTERTTKLWNEVLELMKQERSAGGVLDFDTKIISDITSHAAGYIDKELEQIVGLQTDKPLKRGIMPFGGIRVVRTSVEEHGGKLDPEVERIFKYRKTHNDGVFDVYTDEIKIARSNKLLTGLPDAYGRGRIIGDYRRVALYGVDFLIEQKKEAVQRYVHADMSDDLMRKREELAEQIRALKELKEMAASYGCDISKPAQDTKEAIQWLYFGYLAAVKEQNGAAMSLGRTSTIVKDGSIEVNGTTYVVRELASQEMKNSAGATWDAATAGNAIGTWSASFGDQIDVVASNNDGMGMSMFNAWSKANNVPTFGYDANADAVAAIAEGYGGTISQHADVQAYLTLRVLRNALDGVDVDTGIGTEDDAGNVLSDDVYYYNADERSYYALNVAVTAENYEDFMDSTQVYAPVSNQLDATAHPTKNVWLNIYNAADNFLSATYQPLLEKYDDLLNLNVEYIGGDGQTEANITNRLSNPSQYDAFAINMVKTDNAASYTALLNQ